LVGKDRSLTLSPDWQDHRRSVRVRKRPAKAASGFRGDVDVSSSVFFLQQEDALSTNHAKTIRSALVPSDSSTLPENRLESFPSKKLAKWLPNPVWIWWRWPLRLTHRW
jgi:hypothetical protein